MNLCPLCKSRHNKDHIIIDYNKRNIICNIHNDFYVKYCTECNKDICYKCKDDHRNHNKIDYEDIIHDNENNNELSNYIDKLYNIIDEIIGKLKKIKDNMKIYNNISNKIIENDNRNYETLKNKNEFINFNNKIIADIKKILNNNNINEKLQNIISIYNKINGGSYIIAEIHQFTS